MEYFSKDFHCVAYDMRGYNDSDKPQGIKEYGLNHLCNDVKAVIEGMVISSEASRGPGKTTISFFF